MKMKKDFDVIISNALHSIICAHVKSENSISSRDTALQIVLSINYGMGKNDGGLLVTGMT